MASIPLEGQGCKTKEQKAAWAKASREWSESGFAASAAGVGSLIAGPEAAPFAAAFGIWSLVAGGLSLMYDDWANDPPGGDFTTVPQPERWPVPQVRASRGVSRRAAGAMNQLVRNIATEGSLVRAITEAFERAQAAHQAGEASAEARQLSAALDYATRLTGLIDGRRALVARVRAALRASALAKTRLTRADLRRAQRQIRRHGLPKQMRRTLRRIGLNAADQARIRNRLLKADPGRVKLQSALDVFNDPSLLRTERASAAAFAQLATSLG